MRLAFRARKIIVGRMKIIRGIKNLNIKEKTVVTVGIFDGIHRGHKKILRLLRKRAKALKAKSCVLTFDPHPSKMLHPYKTPPMLVSTDHKLNLLAGEGVDIIVLLNFTKRFAEIPPMQFVREILVKRMNVKELLIGENFLFGKNRSGDAHSLKRLEKKFGFKVHIISPLKIDGKIVSSSLIRSLIMSGKINKAARLMGRDISILGTVKKGARRGRILGFPTANLNPHHEAIPPSGVYIVKARLGNKEYPAILNIGFRPTFKDSKDVEEPNIEVHIFDFNKSIYGKEIEVIFLKKIRNEHKFKSREHLFLRIEKDIEMAKRYFRQEKIDL